MKIHKIEAHCLRAFMAERGLKDEDLKFIPSTRGIGIAVVAKGRIYDCQAVCDCVVEREADS